MPVSMVTLECPCCGREIELVAVGSAHEPDWANAKPRRKYRRSKPEEDQQDQRTATWRWLADVFKGYDLPSDHPRWPVGDVI
jgi:hypothetical protein